MLKFLLLFGEHGKKGICDRKLFHESLRGSNGVDVYLSWYFFQRFVPELACISFFICRDSGLESRVSFDLCAITESVKTTTTETKAGLLLLFHFKTGLFKLPRLPLNP